MDISCSLFIWRLFLFCKSSICRRSEFVHLRFGRRLKMSSYTVPQNGPRLVSMEEIKKYITDKVLKSFTTACSAHQGDLLNLDARLRATTAQRDKLTVKVHNLQRQVQELTRIAKLMADNPSKNVLSDNRFFCRSVGLQVPSASGQEDSSFASSSNALKREVPEFIPHLSGPSVIPETPLPFPTTTISKVTVEEITEAVSPTPPSTLILQPVPEEMTSMSPEPRLQEEKDLTPVATGPRRLGERKDLTPRTIPSTFVDENDCEPTEQKMSGPGPSTTLDPQIAALDVIRRLQQNNQILFEPVPTQPSSDPITPSSSSQQPMNTTKSRIPLILDGVKCYTDEESMKTLMSGNRCKLISTGNGVIETRALAVSKDNNSQFISTPINANVQDVTQPGLSKEMNPSTSSYNRNIPPAKTYGVPKSTVRPTLTVTPQSTAPGSPKGPPLPPRPSYKSVDKELIPPQPFLSVLPQADDILLTLNHGPTTAEITRYQIFYYEELIIGGEKPTHWTLVTEVEGRNPPLACRIPNLRRGHMYNFVVRGVETNGYKGPFSEMVTVSMAG